MSNYNEFDDPRRGAGFLSNVGPKAAFFIVLIALSFMIGVVWKLYVGGGSQTGQDIPIVRADDAPFKVTPDEPGGMDIPNRDSTIFSSLNNSDDDSRIENLLAETDDEEPMPRSQLFAGLNTEPPELAETTEEPLRSKIDEMATGKIETAEEVEAVVDEIIEETSKSVIPSAPVKTQETPAIVPEKVAPVAETVTEKVEPVAEVAPEPAPAPAPKPAPKAEPKPQPITPPAPATAMASGDYYVQLGSVKTADGAESEWKKIVAKYPSILSGFNHRVETANLGDKGTFYRIQAGPVSKAKATDACNAIKKINPNGCLLKKK